MTVDQSPTLDLAPIRAIYPFAQHYFDLPCGRMHYLDEGSGPVVIMLHGNPTWSFYYRRLVLALRDRFRVIVPDHIGCGLSDKPQNYSYRLADHIVNVGALVRHLGIREADMIVHDWGGAIGFGAATAGAFSARRLVVLNTAAFLSRHVPLRIAVCRVPLVGDIAIRALNGFAGAATFMAVAQPLEPLVRQGYLLPYRSYHDRVANLRFVQDIPLAPSHPTWATVAQIGQQLPMFRDTPMQILWGGKDWCFDDQFLAEWMQRFPQAAVQRFDDAGHYVLEDAHAEIVPRVYSFLTR